MAKDFSKFHALKDKYPDRILLFRENNNVYQAYGNDATICGKLLNLEVKTLDNDMKYVEFSVWAFDLYLRILLKEEKLIAICDSIEEKKYISKRNIKDI